MLETELMTELLADITKPALPVLSGTVDMNCKRCGVAVVGVVLLIILRAQSWMPRAALVKAKSEIELSLARRSHDYIFSLGVWIHLNQKESKN